MVLLLILLVMFNLNIIREKGDDLEIIRVSAVEVRKGVLHVMLPRRTNSFKLRVIGFKLKAECWFMLPEKRFKELHRIDW